MKKFLSLALCLLMILSLVACGGEEPAAVDADPAPVEQNEVAAEEPAEDQAAAPAEVSDFEEVIVVDNEECTIKITGIEYDSIWGYTLKAFLENKSADKIYMFSVDSASVDGVDCDPFFATDVAAGKKANEDITFSADILEEIGVTYSDICLSFRVYDNEDWSADNVAAETVHIYPYGEDKAVKYVREAQAADTVLVDNDYVTAIITGYEYNDIWGYSANIYLVNKTDVNVMFSVDEASVNGFMADPFWATTVSAGNCAFSSMAWSDTTLEENGITEVEEIEFTFRAYNSDDWMADDFVNDIFTLNP